jgi:TPR repeat protein
MADANMIEGYRQRAAAGDPDAEYALAWEYVRGEFVPKDTRVAIQLLREFEKTCPELARFNIAKIKYAEDDCSFVDDIRADCAAGFGPSLYLMGVYSLKKVGGEKGRASAIEFFNAGAENGHLPSEFAVWRLSKLGWWRRLATVIPAHGLFLRGFRIAYRNEGDIRILR